MLHRIALILLLLTIPLSHGQAEAMLDSSKEKDFWKWFQKNEAMLYSFEDHPKIAFTQLSAELGKVDENLAFLFGPPHESGTREFIITANGLAVAFPAVEALYNAAPDLPRWAFGKFRPRAGPPEHIVLEGRTLLIEDISYRMYEIGEKVKLLIFMKGLTEREQYFFQHIGFLFLDHTLGEYDVGTKVGFIEFLPASDTKASGASPLTDLAAQFDWYFEQRKKGLH